MLSQAHMNTPMMLALAVLVSIGQEGVADSVTEVFSSRESLQAAVQHHLDYLEAADAISGDDPRRLHTADAIQAQHLLIGTPGANETSRRLFLPLVPPAIVAGLTMIAPFVLQGAVTGVTHWVAGKALDYLFGRRLGTSEGHWSSTNTGVNVGLKADALHKVHHEAAALAAGLKHLAGHEEFAQMGNPDIAALLSAAIIHDLTKVTTKMTVASARNPTQEGYRTYSSLKHPEQQMKVASATNLAQMLVDNGPANGRRLGMWQGGFWPGFTNWLSEGWLHGILGPYTHHVVKNHIMKTKVTEALSLYDSTSTDTSADVATACTCKGNGGCDCAWTGANKEYCGNNDGTPCYSSCCHVDDQGASACRGLCNEEKWTSPQSCYQKQCEGCPVPTWNNQLPEVCADCAENNCHKADLLSQWEVEKVLETKPWRQSQLVQISLCLSVGAAVMVSLGIIVISRSRKQSGHGPYSIPSHQEDSVAEE